MDTDTRHGRDRDYTIFLFEIETMCLIELSLPLWILQQSLGLGILNNVDWRISWCADDGMEYMGR